MSFYITKKKIRNNFKPLDSILGYMVDKIVIDKEKKPLIEKTENGFVFNYRKNGVYVDTKKYNCPSSGCNGVLVVRSGKFGNFEGCSNYPQCKFTRKIK